MHSKALTAFPKLPPTWHLDVWRVDQGIPENDVKALCQTPDGYLWIGTPSGLARFDGNRFVVFNQGNTPALAEVSDDIRVLKTDGDGRLWVGTREGITKFHRGIWENGLKPVLKDRVRIRDLNVASNGHAWVATDRGIRRVVGQSLVTDNLPPMLAQPQYGTTAVFESRDGYLWVTAPEGLLRWHPDRSDPVLIVTDWPVGVSRAGSFAEGRDGTLWAGSPGAIRKVDGLQITSYSLPSGDFSGDNFRPQRLCLDAQDTPWVAIDPQGILCQLRDGKLTPVSGEDGEAISKVQAVLLDLEGNLWCGTSGNGLLRLRREPIGALHLSRSADFLSAVSVMEGPHGEIWMGTENGAVTWWREGAFAFEFKAPLSWESKTYTLGVEPSVGEIWANFATRGVMEVGFAAKTSWIEPNSRAPGWLADQGTVRTLKWTSSETAWLGTTDGLYRVRRSGDRTRFPPAASPQRFDVRSLHEGKDGSLWLGLMKGGLARIPDAEHATEEVKILSWTETDGLPGTSVWCLHEDHSGCLWVGTDRGLACLRNGQIVPLRSEGPIEGTAKPTPNHRARTRDLRQRDHAVARENFELFQRSRLAP